MRAIFILFVFIVLILPSCASVEVAKEVTKATKSIKTSIINITKPKDSKKKENEEKIEIKENEEKIEINEDFEQKLLIEKKQITKDKKRVSMVVKKQKKIATLNLMGKTLTELNQMIGNPQLIRNDRKTSTFRYDSESCRIFVFMNSSLNKPRVEYYELRNVVGDLIDQQKDIEKCFKEIKPV